VIHQSVAGKAQRMVSIHVQGIGARDSIPILYHFIRVRVIIGPFVRLFSARALFVISRATVTLKALMNAAVANISAAPPRIAFTTESRGGDLTLEAATRTGVTTPQIWASSLVIIAAVTMQFDHNGGTRATLSAASIRNQYNTPPEPLAYLDRLLWMSHNPSRLPVTTGKAR
jgi:hypothetical protein